jgi:hypothetical protein
VSRALHSAVAIVLLAVLSGAPAVAVICAELCAPGHQATTDGHSAHHASMAEQQEVAEASSAGGDCHGAPAREGQAIQVRLASRCAEIPGSTPSFAAARLDPAQLLAIAPASAAPMLSPRGRVSHGHPGSVDVTPPGPVAARLVLRI